MTTAVILSAVRTPIGRYGGGLAAVRPDDLAALAIAEAVERAGVPAGEIEDVWFGCANQAGEDNRNVARFAALLAGCPTRVGGRHGEPALRLGPRRRRRRLPRRRRGRRRPLRCRRGRVDDARAARDAKPDEPFARGDRTIYDTTLGWRFVNPRYAERFSTEAMGETGENVAERWGVSREDQDAFALRSQRALGGGRTRRAASPTSSSRPASSTRDEHPRPGDDGREARDAEARVPRRRHRHRGELERDQRRRGCARRRERGEGAALGSRAARHLPRVGCRGRRPRRDGGRADPGRAQAARPHGGRRRRDRPRRAQRGVRLAERRGRARARPRPRPGQRQRRCDRARAPLGMSGARLVVSLLHELRRRDGRYGLATLCVGVGQGQAALFER